MKIELRERTLEHVKIYFEQTQKEIIDEMLPRNIMTLEEAVFNFYQSLKPDATSYGRTIYADGAYIGDIWCYCISKGEEPEAMLSYCIFDERYWGQGITTRAVELFIEEISKDINCFSIGAFCFESNKASIRVLEKNGFVGKESFEEDGIASRYFLKAL